MKKLFLLLLLAAALALCVSAQANVMEAWMQIDRIEPTCTEGGYTLWENFMTMEREHRDQTPALGHDWDGGKVTKEPSCRENGYWTYTCRRCGETRTEAIPTTNDHEFAYISTVEPTCTEDGCELWGCVRCNRDKTIPLPALGHDWGEWRESTPATCTGSGFRIRSCRRCGQRQTEDTPPKGHTPVIVPGKPATCVEPGLTDGETCSVCGAVIKPQTVIPSGGHDFGEWKVTVNGTCVQKEKQAHVCRLCGYEEIKYTGYGDHDWDEGAVTKEPTATEDGIRTYTCKNDPSHTKTEPIPATGKDGGSHPALYLTVAWDEDAGKGKRYEGAEILLYYAVTNTGDCTVYIDSGDYSSPAFFGLAVPNGTAYVPEIGAAMAAVNPGESWTYQSNYPVSAEEVTIGSIDYDSEGVVVDGAQWITADGEVKYVGSNNGVIHIPLTYPEGGEPEEKNPQLEISVTIENPKDAYTVRDTHDPNNQENSIVWYNKTITNTGNVPLYVQSVRTKGTLSPSTTNKGILNPGESETARGRCGIYSSSNIIIKNPEDSPYLGTVPLVFIAIGYDPDDTTVKLCESNAVSFSFNVARPGSTPWEIPEESLLTVQQFEASVHSDPAGYQLLEPWEIKATVTNSGAADLDSYTVELPFTGSSFTGGPIAAGDSQTFTAYSGPVSKEDVERGHILFPAVTVKWTDPDSEKERSAMSGNVSLSILSKTGLLLKKDLAHPAPNGSYFAEGEQIDWTLDVTNNSQEPISQITVTDKGANAGAFDQLAPGEKQPCSVPPYTVTEYDAVAVGYVTNYASAEGTDLQQAVHSYPSNPVTALTRNPLPPIGPGGGSDPLGPVYGVNPALSIAKTDAGPANGMYYELGEEVTFLITVSNTGDCELNGLTLFDSLAGFSAVDSLPSLPAGASHTFSFRYTVTQPNIDQGWAVNSATVTYTFLGGIPGTPMPSNKCYVVCGKDGHLPDDDLIPPFDPALLPADGDFCALTLDRLGSCEADYTLHACPDHAGAASAAETAGLAGNWAQSAALWRAELEKEYDLLWAAASDLAKADLLWERAQYLAYADSLAAAAGDEAAAEALRLRCADLCCMIHTFPARLPSSLAGDYAVDSLLTPAQNEAVRVIGALSGSDSEVTETYSGPSARALNDVVELLQSASPYDADDVFARGQILWQCALDEHVNPVHRAAGKEERKLIAAWRVSLDSVLTAQRPFLELLYRDNGEVVEETLMNLYKNASFDLLKIR